MTDDFVIPEEAVDAACLAMNDGVKSSHYRMRWEPEVRTVLEAALPHLRAQETPRDYKRAYIQVPSGEVHYERAADTKALAETATKLGVKLGRQEAAEEIAAKCLRRAQLAERVPEGERSGVREGMVVTWLAAEKLAREAADG